MNVKKLSIVLLALLASTTLFTSCGDDEPTIDPGTDPVKPVEPEKEETMSSAKQKEYLETVALDFMEMMPSSDFREIAELGKYMADTYGEDYDWDSVGDWAEDIFDAAQQALGTTTTETETEKWGGYTYKYNYVYTNYKAVLLASNFTGHFTAMNGGWKLTKANDLQFIFKDKYGSECVIKLETSGNIKKVHAFDIDDWQDYDWQENGNTYISNDYYDRTQYTIGVPEKIVVTLTQGGSQVVKTTVNVNLGSIANEEFDISKNSLTVSALVELNNGYKFDVSQAAYTANSKASASFTMSKNGKALVTAAVSADISGIPSCNVSAFSGENFDIDDYDTDDANAKNAFVKLDILGRVQMQGTLSDVRKYADYLEDADDYDDDEANFKSYINLANGLTDINLFYDGKATKQATIKLEPFIDETWNGETWWTTEPVLFFYDGSSYSTFEAFFNETDFKKVIDSFKKLANKYADLIDEHIEW